MTRAEELERLMDAVEAAFLGLCNPYKDATRADVKERLSARAALVAFALREPEGGTTGRILEWIEEDVLVFAKDTEAPEPPLGQRVRVTRIEEDK